MYETMRLLVVVLVIVRLLLFSNFFCFIADYSFFFVSFYFFFIDVLFLLWKFFLVALVFKPRTRFTPIGNGQQTPHTLFYWHIPSTFVQLALTVNLILPRPCLYLLYAFYPSFLLFVTHTNSK